MRFRDAFESSPAPSRLGNVRLRYDASILVGEPRPGLRPMTPAALFALGVALAVGAAAALLVPGASPSAQTITGVLLLGLSVVVLGLSRVRERRDRSPPRFVLNFGTVTLRWDEPGRFGQPRTELFRFDDVRSVDIVESATGRWALEVRVAMEAGPERVVRLVDAVRTDERAELDRFARVLTGAFGLGAPKRPTALPEGTSTFLEEDSGPRRPR